MRRWEEDFYSQYRSVIDILNPCMDDYLYILDLQKDTYSISENATERFAIPCKNFENATETMGEFTYKEDYPLLREDVLRIIQKEQDFHNLQYRWLDKKGKPIWINCRGQVLYDEQGEAKYLVGCINEIGNKQKADNISGLLGETVLQNTLQDKIKQRSKGYLFRIGIDNFKEINENKGMNYGDMVLKKSAEAIMKALSDRQSLYKLIADEFVIVDFECDDREAVKQLYANVQSRINDFIAENQYEVFFTISAGVLFFEDVQSRKFENLMKLSEFALSEAKAWGKNRCYIYDREDYRAFRRKKNLLKVMRRSLNENFAGFETYFQPIMDIKRKRLSRAETLLRFYDDKMGFVSPAEFIPLLEESGLIIPVGKWVLEQAAIACSKVQKVIPDFKISVNLSYIQVLKGNVLDEIVEVADKYHLDKKSILVELTESGFLESDANFINFCQGLKQHEILLALDDFGTGYSNFHYLYNINPNIIKIDRSFTLKALQNDYEYNLLKHMADMTHSIDLNFCIEGIETQEELDKICGIEPDYIQGYYFGKPCPFTQFMNDFVQNV